jgi:hypothetical protein
LRHPEYFRHTIWRAINDTLTPCNRGLYWAAFLTGNEDNVLFWILAREDTSAVEAVNQKLKQRTDSNFISRSIFELFAPGGGAKLARMPMTENELTDARRQVDGIGTDTRPSTRFPAGYYIAILMITDC